EPVKGGALAKPDEEIEKLMKVKNPDLSPASWAIRFAAGLDGVLVVLSGMSSLEQMKDNLSYMKDFKPMDKGEMEVLSKIQTILGASKAIPCTACSYCTKGCPKEIPIPDIFKASNLRLSLGQLETSQNAYQEIIKKGNGADACIACGQCESVCPQHLPIIKLLKETADTYR
ncbi:MAG: 4Fe-4S dicluster domain-containing protein, partial [Solobacterium sp.]|nr:4Fe-4S dicluster domain-containing protein [Solobacterium sp.]